MKLLLIILGCLSFASLAQAKIVRFVQVADGIYRAGIPDPEEKDFATLKSQGIKTIINLRDFRTDEEFQESTFAKEFNLNYIRAPLSAVGAAFFFHPDEDKIDQALATIVDPHTPRPLLVHCYAGNDRTSLIVALYRVIFEDWDADTAFKKEMVAYGFKQNLVVYKKYLYDHAKNPEIDRAKIAQIVTQDN